MSDPLRSERPSSGRKKTSSSTSSSTRHERSSRRRSEIPSGSSSAVSSSSRPSRRDAPAAGASTTTTRRRSHSSTGLLPPRREDSVEGHAIMDEETRARLARREERRARRRAELESTGTSEGRSTRRRSSSLPRQQPQQLPPSQPSAARQQQSTTMTSAYARVSRNRTENEEVAFDEAATDATKLMVESPSSLSAKKAAYLRAVEKRDKRARRKLDMPSATSTGTPDIVRSKSADSDDVGSGGAHAVHSPDRSTRSSSSSKHRHRSRSSTSNTIAREERRRGSSSPTPSKRERKSRRVATVTEEDEERRGKMERRRTGDTERSTKSSSSGDRTRKHEKRRSNESSHGGSSSKDRKKSSRVKDDESRSHRSSRTGSRMKEDEKSGRSKDKKRSKEDRSSEHRRSSRKTSEATGERPPKDRSRASSSGRLSSASRQRDEFRSRREERFARGVDDANDEEYNRRKEERQALREERRRTSGSSDQQSVRRSRLRSSSLPRYTEGSSREETSGAAVDVGKASTAYQEGALRSQSGREKGTIDAGRERGLYSSTDAQAARERLQERLAARERAREASMSDSEATPSSRRSLEMGVDDDALVSSRPRLVDVRRRGIASVLKQQRAVGAGTAKVSESSSSSSELLSDSEEELSTDEEDLFAETSADDADDESWTIRVALISAVDLPLNIIPNMPLCPVLKFGIITLPVGEDETGKAPNSEKDEATSVMSRIETSGLSSIPKARVRCTSNKVLSKRDNGSVEFHEEMRWDKVKRPMHAALVVELSARAALAPSNLKESPFVTLSKDSNAASQADTSSSSLSGRTPSDPDSRVGSRMDQTADTKSVDNGGQGQLKKETPLPSLSRSRSEDNEDPVPALHGAGLTGMRALWKRGRQQFEQRQNARITGEPKEGETSSASNHVAGFVAAGMAFGTSEAQSALPQSGLLSRQTAPDRSVPSLADENVALLRPRKRRKLQMTEDLRLGSILIPLTRLPLEEAIQNMEAARIEQWYQLDSYDVLAPTPASPPTWRSKGATKSLPRRSPNVQLEISFSPPEVVDESEDDMDDVSISDLNALDADGAEGKREQDGVPSPSENEPRSIETGDTTRSFARRAAGRSFSRRIASEMRSQEKANDEKVAARATPAPPIKKVPEDPVLEPGMVDFICVVGVSNIGDQKDDDGSRGWVNTSPECNLLEQFPPDNEFHVKNGRNVALANKVEWFCFPEGWKLWRGEGPPSPADLNVQRYSSPSSPIGPNSNAAFDSCLGCTTSFSWFVIASNSDEYGSRNVKTYGAVIKFYVPAPKGIDQTQDDYAQTILGGPVKPKVLKEGSTAKRLWVPMGICMTSNLPIVGVMEAMLLRICETLASADSFTSQQNVLPIIHKDIANLIVNFQTPIPGVLHCSVPFLQGERLHVTLPPPTGLPPLPHGSSVKAVCRILGAEGLNLMLAALLTECKIIIHSEEISNLAMVAEVTTALIYPFYWALPCIPVLPDAMLEFVEAPLSYFLGIPTSSVKLIDPSALEDVVVVDLDSDFGSSGYYDGKRSGKSAKVPTPLPSSVATNIAKAVFRLLREEGEVDEEYGSSNFSGSRSLPRLESESLAEREFRIAVALQVCGLLRGYDGCLFQVSASQPAFNRDKFLKTAPALFENQRGNLPLGGSSSGRGAAQRTLSPRSKRFLSILVNCQHFHQFLHALDDDECAFFNEVMYTFEMSEEHEDDRILGGYGTSPTDDAAAHLSKALQKVEDKIPTYRVERKGKKKERRASGGWDEDDELGIIDQAGLRGKGRDKKISENSFPYNLLKPLCFDPKRSRSSLSRSSNAEDDTSDKDSADGVHTLSVEYLMELEKGNWRYERLFRISDEQDKGEKDATPIVQLRAKVKLREAIGERRYRAWRIVQEQKLSSEDTSARLSSGDVFSAEANPALDLTSLLSSMADDVSSDATSVTQQTITSASTHTSAQASTLTPEQKRVADAKDRDVLRRCLERAYEGSQKNRRSRRSLDEGPDSGSFFENGRDLIAEAETALRNPSAQRFLVSVLSQRSRLDNQKKRRSMIEDPHGSRRQATQTSVSRLETSSFECLVRLCCAMLDSCMEAKNYEPAYGLLTHTAGFCTVQTTDGRRADSRLEDPSHDVNNKVVYMTARIGLHPIFADLRLWEEVLRLHLKDRENDKSPSAGSALIGRTSSNLVEYEAAVATLYEMLGFGIPAEELARFATRVNEEHGWFDTERGHSLLMLARRLGVTREEEGGEEADAAGDLGMMRASGSPQASHPSTGSDPVPSSPAKSGLVSEDIGQLEWSEIGWCHPAAPSSVRAQYVELEGDERTGVSGKRLKRSAVTCVTSFGSSIVASAGLDGSVFVAHTVRFDHRNDEKREGKNAVYGIHLDWGSSGSRTAAVASSLSSMDGEYGVGAVSCLAAAKGAGYRSSALSASSGNKDTRGNANEEDFISAMEGCRVVAGTTAGDLRVWTVKDVYAATVLAKKGPEKGPINANTKERAAHGGTGMTSSFVGKPRGRGLTDIAAGSAFSRLQFSLRGRALSGHRGGVSCVDVPSHIYRPDALITGGADGFIKLWSLRQPMAGRRTSGEGLPGAKASMFSTSIAGANPADQIAQGRTGRSGDALSILSGHTGRVLCVKTAWHGDRLLSGGADRTVRIWDLAGSGGKCYHTLTGHLGWVTQAHYWGSNTIVTGSTDRSIALWDPRVRRTPLFILRHHYSPVSDLLVGPRTDPLMISAGGDGTIATWDFRTLSGSNSKGSARVEESSSPRKTAETNGKHAKAIRTPIAKMRHSAEGRGVRQSAAVMLARGVTHQNTVFSTGVDAIVREWDIPSGRLVGQEATGHCDAVSGFATFSDSQNALATASAETNGEGHSKHRGIITSSWDGTVRLRKFVRI